MIGSAGGHRRRSRCLRLLLPLLLSGAGAAMAAQRERPSPDLAAVAAAVEDAESSHCKDPRMWRPDPQGPQGPMQITAAAAEDVGGGDRFDPGSNRALGRAYLARMYRRFGSWDDAVAAYNWGPGRLDGWIRKGRSPERFPSAVERYRERVLSQSSAPASPLAATGLRRPLLLGVGHAQPHRPPGPPNAADREVEALFAEVTAATATH